MDFYVLDFRDRDVGGAVMNGTLTATDGTRLPASEALATLQGADRIAVLVHGFNVDRPSGREQLDVLARSIGTPADVCLGVCWPGDSWAGPAGYPLEGNDADDSGSMLADFLDLHCNPGSEISFVTHSMGGRVALEAVRALDSRRFIVREICLAAPAVDDDVLNRGERYYGVAQGARRVTVLASKSDGVLKWAYPIGDLVQAWAFFWKDKPGSALGRAGPRSDPSEPTSPRVRHEQIATDLNVGHSDYISSSGVAWKLTRCADFVRQVLAGDSSPRY
jgi:hypothetical protein